MSETKSPNLDRYESAMPGYLADGSGMPAICSALRGLLADGSLASFLDRGDVDAPVQRLTENLYHGQGRGNMGRGDVKRAIWAAMSDIEGGLR